MCGNPVYKLMPLFVGVSYNYRFFIEKLLLDFFFDRIEKGKHIKLNMSLWDASKL